MKEKVKMLRIVQKDWYYMLIWLLFSGFIFYYLHIASGIMPYMDFWLELDSYVDIIVDNPFYQIKEFFSINHPVHSAPALSIVHNFIMILSKANNLAYVYVGGVFLSINIGLYLYIVRRHFRTKSSLANIMIAVVCCMPAINLNQWEILTLYCNAAFMIRINLYLVSFILIDRFLIDNKRSISKAILFSVFVFVIVNWFSQAYYVGYIVAITSVCVFYTIKHKKNIDTKSKRMIGTILLSAVVSTLFNVLTLAPNANGTAIQKVTQSFGEMLILFFKGIVIMLGSTIVPQSAQTGNLGNVYIVGIAILCLAIIAVILYFFFKLYEHTYFPIMCMIYAFVTILVICYGRIPIYGISYLSSSRYVVETTIGLIGMLQIYAYSLIRIKILCIRSITAIVALYSVAVMICYANHIEMGTGPYRRAYNDNLVVLAQNIDMVTDEELGVFQAPPLEVRNGIETLKKYHWSIWKE